MPRVSEFFGIVIRFFYNDHAPPHFHAEYGAHEAVYEIETLEELRGGLPRRAHEMVVEWATIHRREPAEDWELSRLRLPLLDTQPLD